MTDSDDPLDPDDETTVAAIRRHRLDKLDALRADGVAPYPYRYDRSTSIGAIRERHGALEAGTETDEVVRIAGRILLKRTQGKLIFATVRDVSGDIQLFVSKAVIGDDAFATFGDLDLGDWVGVEGTVMVTKRGELSVKVTEAALLAKALRPLPDKWHGLADVDTRYRQRYVDLVVNEDARRAFEIRHRAIAALRDTLNGRGFVEVETPVLNLQQGGATARPFVTHYNALDLDVYLRIALELPLKRLVVAGMERVYEIGRVFRNEGLDTRHNPEFTMLEAYEAFTDYFGMMDLTEALVVAAATAATGGTVVHARGADIDLAGPWPRVTMTQLIAETVDIEVHPSMSLEDARAAAARLDVAVKPTWGPGKIVAEIYDERVESHIVRPTIVMDYPRETSPLAKPHRDDPSLVERFEVIVAGRELANAYSELNDPLDQLERFRAEAANKAAGDDEAGDVDLDYIRALEYGLPPTGGLGIGVDRLVMLLTGMDSIREVILFPTLRPEVGLTDGDFPRPS